MLKEFSIGIIKETQQPADSRVALTPNGAQQLLKINKTLNILVQPSKDRAYTENEYIEAGCVITDDLSDCDLLLGVKEVVKEKLISRKRYMFFSHTAKKQPHNQQLLQSIINKNITLIDYEFIYGARKTRIVAFGYWAGLVGAYNTLRAYGIKNNLFQLLPLYQISSKSEMFKELNKVVGGKDKILITGSGRVAQGVEEIMQACGIFKVDIDGFFNQTYHDPVYFISDPLTYAKHEQGIPFTFKDFKSHPKKFKSNFLRFAEVADVFIAAHYWDPQSPKFFNIQQTQSELFKIKIIGDITCDIEGSIPTTIKTTTLKDPYYDFDPKTASIQPPFSNDEYITVMAIDKLPGALPRESSEYFSEQLVNHVLGYFWIGDYNKVLKNATIASHGKIMKRFRHLRTFIQEKL